MVFALSASLLLPFASATPAYAAGLVPCGDTSSSSTTSTGTPTVTNPCKLADFFKLLARVANFMVAFAGLYAALRIIMSAARLVTAGGNQESIATGKEGLTNAMVGLIIVLLAYVIINTIFGVFAPKVGISNQNGFLYNPFL